MMTLLGEREISFAVTAFAIGVIWAALVLSGTALVLGIVLALILSLLLAIDSHHMILPNGLNALLAASGLVATIVLHDGALWERLAALAAGFALLASVAWVYRCWRGRDGLGLGDAKLFGALGAWVGLEGLPSLLLIGALGGLAFAFARAAMLGAVTLKQRLAFGPFLALGCWVVWLYGPLN